MTTNERIAEVVTKAWVSVLGEPAIDPADRFFDLGGDSMMAVLMIERSKAELGLPYPLESIFVDDSLSGVINTFISAKPAAEERR
jgi:acyl carrier protein